MPVTSPRPLTAVLATLALVVLGYGYSSGPASSNGSAFTGAPSAGGGTEATCGICHGTGNYGEPRLAARFAGMENLTYVPGRTYTVTVSVQAEEGAPAAYGFQAQFLDGGDPILQPAGSLSDPDAATQIATLDSGRSYAEHKGPNTDSLFTFSWTAPGEGTGPVSMYLVGNTVNRAGGESGDNGSTAPLVLKLEEGERATATAEAPTVAAIGLFPNPAGSFTRLDLGDVRGGVYHLTITDASGRTWQNRVHALAAGEQTLRLEVSDLPAGIYYCQVSGPDLRTTLPFQRR